MTQPAVPQPEEITRMFTRAGGDYLFARWSRPIVPVVFGVDDATLATVKAAIEAVVALAGHRMAETDPELGANLMIFFFRDWKELLDVPGLDHLVEGLAGTVARLDAAEANQYRAFRFEKDGAIRACFVFIRVDAALDDTPAETVALSLAARSILFWGDHAFERYPALAELDGAAVIHPAMALVIRAAYDPSMPHSARDPGHALRLAARVGLLSAEAGK
ncbi:hypothetical protein D2T31_07740 [Sinirhodobacter populi]|uniref:Uncharacterized protein n=1 Tax=Paenirhodobacter populi TaxID=2306993 RepID=A0A443KBZ5_9RHOB|nr:hypothetical protein [Sinirhodobacter populi]RWR30304.1 hypothetical protein D2T31_07740 [Sinirhodobacter populi]